VAAEEAGEAPEVSAAVEEAEEGEILAEVSAGVEAVGASEEGEEEGSRRDPTYLPLTYTCHYVLESTRTRRCYSNIFLLSLTYADLLLVNIKRVPFGRHWRLACRWGSRLMAVHVLKLLGHLVLHVSHLVAHLMRLVGLALHLLLGGLVGQWRSRNSTGTAGGHGLLLLVCRTRDSAEISTTARTHHPSWQCLLTLRHRHSHIRRLQLHLSRVHHPTLQLLRHHHSRMRLHLLLSGLAALQRQRARMHLALLRHWLLTASSLRRARTGRSRLV